MFGLKEILVVCITSVLSGIYLLVSFENIKRNLSKNKLNIFNVKM